jgi:Flp pilus assembly protein TadD
MGEGGALFQSSDVRLLVDIGFIAQSRGLIGHAAAIFDGVLTLRPKAEAGAIGRALCDLQAGDCTAAIERLRRAPPTDAARLFLGMALAQLGDTSEARRVLSDVVATARAPSAVDLAQALLDSLDA